MSIIGSAVRRNVVIGIVAVVGGFLGSTLHDLTIAKPTTVRAERFEVVERSGRLLSYWGPDGDRNKHATTPKGTLLVFLDSQGVRRFQIGEDSGGSPHLLLYDKDGPPDTPKRYDAQPRLGIQLGWTGSPVLNMLGGHGDKVVLGATYGDVYGEQELGWGLYFAAFKIPAKAWIGYSRGWDGSYRSGIFVTDGAGKRWDAGVGEYR